MSTRAPPPTPYRYYSNERHRGWTTNSSLVAERFPPLVVARTHAAEQSHPTAPGPGGCTCSAGEKHCVGLVTTTEPQNTGRTVATWSNPSPTRTDRSQPWRGCPDRLPGLAASRGRWRRNACTAPTRGRQSLLPAMLRDDQVVISFRGGRCVARHPCPRHLRITP